MPNESDVTKNTTNATAPQTNNTGFLGTVKTKISQAGSAISGVASSTGNTVKNAANSTIKTVSSAATATLAKDPNGAVQGYSVVEIGKFLPI